MSNILITGVAGFIGSNLAERLLGEGYRVVGLDNLSYGVDSQIPANVEFYQKDIRDPDLENVFSGIDYVYHLAAKNCISDCQEDPLDTVSINVRGTLNILEYCRKAKIKKIIYAESSAVYEGVKKFPTNEDEICPKSIYAISKYTTGLFSQAYTKHFGLKTTGLRYFNVYGPKQDYRRTIPPLFSAFIIALLKSQTPTIYGDGSKRRDFIYNK